MQIVLHKHPHRCLHTYLSKPNGESGCTLCYIGILYRCFHTQLPKPNVAAGSSYCHMSILTGACTLTCPKQTVRWVARTVTCASLQVLTHKLVHTGASTQSWPKHTVRRVAHSGTFASLPSTSTNQTDLSHWKQHAMNASLVVSGVHLHGDFSAHTYLSYTLCP